MSEKPQPCRHKRPFCLECHGSEFQGGVSVKRTAIEYLKRNHPSACERAGLCETIGGRQYTVTLSCHGYVLAADYEALQAECEKLREHLQNLIDQTTPLVPVPGNPMWSRRIQLDEVMAERDQLQAECEKLLTVIRSLCNIYVVDDYWFGDLREEELSRAVERAIDTAMEGGKP